MKTIKIFNGSKHKIEYKVFFIKYKNVPQKKALHLVKREIDEPHDRIVNRLTRSKINLDIKKVKGGINR